jgi:hypothetical protein
MRGDSERGDSEKALKIGSALTLMAGLVPGLVGLVFYGLFHWSVAHPSEPWRAEPLKDAGYSIDDIRQWNAEVATDWILGAGVKFVNVVNTGFFVVVVSAFGLRRGEKWAWWTLLAVFVWVGLTEAPAFIQAGRLPLPLAGEALAIPGLLLTRRAVFAKE